MARVPQPEMWARVRAELGCAPAVAIDPSKNLLLGVKAITEYLHVSDRRILARWIDEFGLPVIYRPDGQLMSSITSIDQWILLASRVSYENKFAAGQTTIQKRERTIQKWREDSTPPTVSALYRYGASPEINEFRPRAVYRSPRRMAVARSVTGSRDGPSGNRPGQVHDSPSLPSEDEWLQRQNRNLNRHNSQLQSPLGQPDRGPLEGSRPSSGDSPKPPPHRHGGDDSGGTGGE